MNPIGIIGGSGLENPELLKNPSAKRLNTPYGEILYKTGMVGDKDVIFLSRHGQNHAIPPSQINNQANIWGLKHLNCSYVLATTACGSLREEISRGMFVIPDQFIDFTRHRETTFFNAFENGEMKHTPMADPFDRELRDRLVTACHSLEIAVADRGTLITIEGPRFSSRAESNMFRLWGADLINMSTAPEVILANEIALPYATIAMSTDYDCWKTDEEPATWQAVLSIFKQNTAKMIDVLKEVIALG